MTRNAIDTIKQLISYTLYTRPFVSTCFSQQSDFYASVFQTYIFYSYSQINIFDNITVLKFAQSSGCKVFEDLAYFHCNCS